MAQPKGNKSRVSPAELTLIGAAGGFIEVCLLQPTVGIKNALQEGRPIPRSVAHLYRGLGVSRSAPIALLQCCWRHAAARQRSCPDAGIVA
jgi:hypothetical protein